MKTSNRSTGSAPAQPAPSAPVRVVYVPGLGDRSSPLVRAQRVALGAWRRFGVRTTLFAVGWSSDARFEDRLVALEGIVDRALARGEEVALVGASAGASAVLAAFARRPGSIRAVTIVCGKIHDVSAIPEPVLDHNDVFEEALAVLPALMGRLGPQERGRILSLRSAQDAIVPPEDTIVRGAHNEKMRMLGHVSGIAYALLFLGRHIVRFSRRPGVVRDGSAPSPAP